MFLSLGHTFFRAEVFWEPGQGSPYPGAQALAGSEGSACGVPLKRATSAGFGGKGDLQNCAALEIKTGAP